MKFNASKFNKHWQDKALDELGDFQRGKSRHRPRNDMALFEGGIHPLVQTGEIKAANLYITNHTAMYNDFGLSQSKLWPKDTLCITIAANIAETALLEYPMCFPDSVVGFNAYPNESSELFMHYVFTYIRRAIQNSASGSIQDNINIDYLSSLKFKIPHKSYQQKIAAVLSALDAKIDCNNRINAELEAMAKTLYDYWFVQFDFPFDFAQDKPDENGKPYRSSGGKMAYNPTLKREIPAGWGCMPFSHYLVCNQFKLGNKHKLTEINYLDTANLTRNVIHALQPLKLGTDNIPSRAKMIVKQNDILYSTVRPNQYHFGIIKQPVENMIASTGFAVISHKENSSFNDIFYLFLTSKPILQRMIKISESSKSSYPSISPADILNLDIACPESNQLFEYAYIILGPIFEKINVVQKENQHLTQLRDWLLPMLMNGQVTVE